MIELSTLGKLDLRVRGGNVLGSVLSQPKRAALLVYLTLAEPRGFHRRDTLIGIFWPESDEEHARAALRQSVYFLRQEPGEGVLITRGAEEIAIRPDAVWCDAVALECALIEGDAEAAVDLARGELLPGFMAAATAAATAARARIAFARAQPDSALILSRQVTRTPGSWSVADWAVEAWTVDAARYHVATGDAKSAARHLVGMHNLLVESPAVVLLRGDLEERAGNLQEARRHYTRLLELPSVQAETKELQRRARARLRSVAIGSSRE